ncbi:Peroxidasin [Folsomia candida]|uniref:peroxidase n=2 Tax=Folsomia candida TaxID=158441 RepID=A0A226ES14_FOLCA|nr:Peroxidasin [Folsomia candida]
MQTLWMREHNRVARELSNLGGDWSDEILFQEARRIVTAEIQHVTYSEFLPVILGQELVEKYDLRPMSTGYYSGYDIGTNAGVLNGVATAALWFFASLVPKVMPFYDSIGRKVDEKAISDTFYAPFDLYRNGVLDQILRGLLRGKAQSEDQFINDVMTNRMFEDPDTGLGLDLAAQLIQQGRDHGIPGYVFYRELCGLGKVSNFSELRGTMSNQVIASLSILYKVPEDVDLFTGGLAEYTIEGGVVGPTFGCLLGIQFQKLRKGDRFWYENDLPPSAFSPEQLQEIRKTTLARIICDNSNSVNQVQPNVFLDRNPFLNAPMHCEGDAIRHIDLKKWSNEMPPQSRSSKSSLPNSQLSQAIQQARSDIVLFHSREMDLWKNASNVDPLSPIGTASGFNKAKNQALEIANASFLLQFATERFLSEVGGSISLQDSEGSPDGGTSGSRNLRQILNSLQSIDVGALTELPKNQRCSEHDLPCDHTNIFRSITGWCNNLQDPKRGKAFEAFVRLLPPTYDDGLKEPRIFSSAIPGKLLPSARLVSSTLHDDISVPHVRYTLLLMQFAQLLDHDLTHTPINRGFDNSILNCHSCDSRTTSHPECWPIVIPPRDPHFPQFNSSTGHPVCLPFTRSLPGQLTLGYREQLNQVTAYLDASFVYGSDVCEARKLRSFEGGKLNTTRHPGGDEYKPLLPQTPSHPECKAPSGLCFEAGDLRASEQPVLAVIHTIWLREHNRISSALAVRNPQWGDETIYQHARRILSATTQHITYAEFLPRVLGWDVVHKFGLDLLPDGYATTYQPTCNPTIFNEFAAAAFRFGHSLLKPSFKRMSPSLRILEPSVQLRHTFFKPDLLFNVGIVDELLVGLVNTPMETLDSFITEEVTNHLFEDRKRPISGMDLAALNVQRGRDHGVASYNEYRAVCNLTKAVTFDDLRKEIPPRLVQKFKRIYASVDDIDLFPGGLAETAVMGGIVGPTFACIIAKQFHSLRHCDRFWYENAEPLTRFTTMQLAEIRKSSLAKLLCDNGDEIRSIQRSALDVPDQFLNPRTDCASLPALDFDWWTDRVECIVKGKSIKVGAALRVSPCVMCTCTKEGPLCQSMKINNCVRLSRLYEARELVEDHVCKVQCALVFKVFPTTTNNTTREIGNNTL